MSRAPAPPRSSYLRNRPNSAEPHEFAGEVEFRQGEMERAEAEFRKAIQLEPKFGRAWWGLARVFDCSSLHGVARRFFTRAHQLAPDDSDILWSYASTLTGAERIAALENSLQRADPATDPKKIERRRDHVEIEKKLVGRHPSRLASPYEVTQIHLEPLLNGMRRLDGFGLKVRINDAKPITLMLDTGTSGILLGTKAAEKAGLSKLGDAPIGGLGYEGWKNGYAALASRVRIASVEFADVVVAVGEVKEVGTDEAGLIAVFAPMPSASVRTAAAVNPGSSVSCGIPKEAIEPLERPSIR